MKLFSILLTCVVALVVAGAGAASSTTTYSITKTGLSDGFLWNGKTMADLGAFEISFVLEDFAVLIAADDPLTAARLLGKGDALREPSSARLERHEEHRVERATASTKAQLDEAQWARAWAEGRRLSLDDAIQLALVGHGAPAPT